MGELTDLQGHTYQLDAQLWLALSKHVLQILLRMRQNINFLKIFLNLQKKQYKNQLIWNSSNTETIRWSCPCLQVFSLFEFGDNHLGIEN